VGDTWDTRAELAGREGLALLYLAAEVTRRRRTEEEERRRSFGGGGR
jgi:hypothetical protein